MRSLLLALALVTAGTAAAQAEWRSLPPGPSLSLDVLSAIGGEELLITDAEGGEIGRTETTAVALLLSGRVPVGARWAVRAELPLAYARFSGPGGAGSTFDESDAVVGNPYLGIETSIGPTLVLGGGVRVPVFTEITDTETFGWQGGTRADTERFEAYLPEVLTVSASADYAAPLSPTVRLRGRLAPAVVADVSGAENANNPSATDWMLGYGLQAEAEVGAVTLRGGVVGRPFLTGRRFEGLETLATALLGVATGVGGARVGVLGRIPLDGPSFRSDATLGLTVDVPFR